jgi:hypothetical protein
LQGLDMSESEPRNPFYLLLLLVSLLFVITALAYAVVPVLVEKAIQAGQPPPSSPLREALRRDGWIWLLAQVGGIILLSFLSMGLDRLRSLRKERQAVIIPPAGDKSLPQ